MHEYTLNNIFRAPQPAINTTIGTSQSINASAYIHIYGRQTEMYTNLRSIGAIARAYYIREKSARCAISIEKRLSFYISILVSRCTIYTCGLLSLIDQRLSDCFFFSGVYPPAASFRAQQVHPTYFIISLGSFSGCPIVLFEFLSGQINDA